MELLFRNKNIFEAVRKGQKNELINTFIEIFLELKKLKNNINIL